jgi:hypothetical protein
MGARGVASALSAVLLAGCGSQLDSASTAPTSANAAGPRTAHLRRPERSRSYQLYTHCGIQGAMINGTYWRAMRRLSDGNGNPPPGWGNPYQQGALILLSGTRASFQSPAGTVRFERTARLRPPFICS